MPEENPSAEYATWKEIATALGVSDRVARVIVATGVTPHRRTRKGHFRVLRSDLPDLRENTDTYRQVLTTSTNPEVLRLERDRRRQETKTARYNLLAERRTVATSALTATIPVRDRSPSSVTVHVGPTNSGKTHDALTFLASRGQGVYAAPLRMLALEAYERLKVVLGEEEVGLVTGEEQVNPEAPVLCVTPEMAPLEGDTLVLDEFQWLADKDRGWAWARLMAFGSYEHVHLCGAPEGESVARLAYHDARDVKVVTHERLEKITFAGSVDTSSIPTDSIVVAFTRKGVLSIGRDLAGEERPSVLYGALPPQVRRLEVERFTDGNVSRMVATDVIGHGVNLPARNVVIAETSKYDGTSRRDLYLWELAQIVGRAGRHGLGGDGKVFVLRGKKGFTPDARLVERAVQAARGDIPPRGDLTSSEVRPRLRDLNATHPGDLGFLLTKWQAEMRKALKEHPWLVPLDVRPLVERFDVIAGLMPPADTTWPLSVEEAWQLISMPVNHATPGALYPALVEAVAGRGKRLQAFLVLEDRLDGLDVEGLEGFVRGARDLRAFTTTFPENNLVTPEDAQRLEEKGSSRLGQRLDEAVRTNPFGRCQTCGRECPPWFSSCQVCHHSFDDW